MDADTITAVEVAPIAEPIAAPIAEPIAAPVVFIDLTLPEDPEVIQERKRARREESSLERRTNQMLAATAVQNAILEDFTRNPDKEEIKEDELTLHKVLLRIKCAVCLERFKSTLILPCRHMATCFDCTVVLRDGCKRCPMCNQTFDRYLTVFY